MGSAIRKEMCIYKVFMFKRVFTKDITNDIPEGQLLGKPRMPIQGHS